MKPSLPYLDIANELPVAFKNENCKLRYKYTTQTIKLLVNETCYGNISELYQYSPRVTDVSQKEPHSGFDSGSLCNM
jgi:hypothetical protein